MVPRSVTSAFILAQLGAYLDAATLGADTAEAPGNPPEREEPGVEEASPGASLLVTILPPLRQALHQGVTFRYIVQRGNRVQTVIS